MKSSIKKVKNVADKLMKVVTSPKVVLAFNAAGALLQLLHQVQAYRQGNRKIGFQTNDERE